MDRVQKNVEAKKTIFISMDIVYRQKNHEIVFSMGGYIKMNIYLEQ